HRLTGCAKRSSSAEESGFETSVHFFRRNILAARRNLPHEDSTPNPLPLWPDRATYNNDPIFVVEEEDVVPLSHSQNFLNPLGKLDRTFEVMRASASFSPGMEGVIKRYL